MSESSKKFKRKLYGKVVSQSGAKTIVVEVQRRFKDPKYSKFITRTKKYHAHDEESKAQVGQKVAIIESRPYSKLKRWELLQVRD
ncbi:MAG: 30S ribosomal protein S17 [Halobacteriovoraceae bacterium]|nr:30S ribosomal protein S17 [Halobacteriovoraceae bacterium]